MNRILMSLGAAVAAGRVVNTLTGFRADDVLCALGLSRRRNTSMENAALIGLGVVLGAGTALLLAPTDGEEARRRVSEGLSKARDASAKLVNDARARAPELIEAAKQKLHEDEAKHQHA